MSSLFVDERYENMDWLSRVTEPMESKLNEHLASLPDLYEVTLQSMQELMQRNKTMSLTKGQLIEYLCEKNGQAIDHENLKYINNCFLLELEPDTVLDFEVGTFTGAIKLRKIKKAFDDDKIREIMAELASNSIHYYAEGEASRLNEVGEILGCGPELFRTRSCRKKQQQIALKYKEILQTDKWKIRNVELAVKAGRWLMEYAVDNNAASWANFCQLKVMTHGGQPIYSVKEAD